jgi:predicted AAA+ superfamily ATPase
MKQWQSPVQRDIDRFCVAEALGKTGDPFNMTLKPWREIAVPHEDVHKGTFVQAEFAADITRVHDGSATSEYQDPVLFFQRTFITEGMATLLTSVAKRLAGKGGDPVIQLQTAFGGGKTHTMLAVMHLVAAKAPKSDLAGIPAVLDRAGVIDLPRARVVVLDGIKISPSQIRRVEGHSVRTLWGELAWQLGGAEAYARVADADATGTSPGKDVLAELLRTYSPCVILVDELVAYIRQFEEGKALPGGTYDSNLTFVQALTEALKAAPTSTMLASLPESEREAGSERGIAALKALEHYFGRVQAIWKPVSTDESFEIVRRRLFREIRDRAAADAVCRAFADQYVKHADDLPGETQEGRYYDRLRSAYPIHPEVFERLYKDWSALPNFQRTRGVLKLMARVIHRLWQDNNTDLLVLPGSIPLYDRDVHGELANYLPAGWDPVIERDVDGEGSEPARLETAEPRFGAVQACRRMTRSIFLGSAPSSSNEMARGIETERLILSCLQPGQAPHIYRDALARLESRLTFLNKANNRWWLDVRPNLRREMEDRKRRFGDQDVSDAIRTALNRVMGPAPDYAVHVFTQADDIPDDWSLRLVVLPPGAGWTRSGPNKARDLAAAILRMRGDAPRQKQNRMLFLAADADQVMHLRETARALLAWKSIETDISELRLTLDNQQSRQATRNREQTYETMLRLVRDTFKWLVAPTQGLKRDGELGEIEWEAHTLNPATPGLGKEIDRTLDENELVIREWAPIHLHDVLKRWFWKEDVADVPALDVWQKMCQYLYFPRLASSRVMQSAIAAGAPSRDFFGIAYSKEGETYRGFQFGKPTTPVFDEALLLIETAHAAAYEDRMRTSEARTDKTGPTPPSVIGPPPPLPPLVVGPAARPTCFYAKAELNPLHASLQFSKIVDELIGLFTSTVGARVKIRVDIEAEDPDGFAEDTIRAAKENARTLGLDPPYFETGR